MTTTRAICVCRQELVAQNKEIENQLFITIEGSGKIYLHYETFHLIKKVRNNLLGSKILIFPPFTFHILSMEDNFPGSCPKTCMKMMNPAVLV